MLRLAFFKIEILLVWLKHYSIAVLVGLLSVMGEVNGQTFELDQRKYPRVEEAFLAKEAVLRKHALERGFSFPPQKIFFRAFKMDKELECWMWSEQQQAYRLFKTYKVCRLSGGVGPKRMQGDLQMPEGFYHIDRFNPTSNFWLSLGLNYPNESDRQLGNRSKLGGDIFIHGSCATIGCFPMTDDLMKEIYVISVLARNEGQRKIPVHVFPTRMESSNMRLVRQHFKHDRKMIQFWDNLLEGYRLFEQNKRLPNVRIDGNGRYYFSY